MHHALLTHYFPHRRVNQLITSTVALFVSGSINTRDLLAVRTILASLSVRTTVGHLRVGGWDLGMLDASAESLAHLFLLAVLVSEAEETVEAIHVRR